MAGESLDGQLIAAARRWLKTITPAPWDVQEDTITDEDGEEWATIVGITPPFPSVRCEFRGDGTIHGDVQMLNDADIVCFLINHASELFDAFEERDRYRAELERIRQEVMPDAKPPVLYGPEQQQFADGWDAAMGRIATLLQSKGDNGE